MDTRQLSGPTLIEIQSWPATVDVALASTAFGISRAHGYELVTQDSFPAKVLKVGGRYRVITSSILAALA